VAMDPAADKSEDWQGTASATGTFEGAGVIPRGGQFGALVAYPNGRGVVLYDGELRWGECLESRSGVKILLLDDAGSDHKRRYVDESGNSFSSWLAAQRKARRRKAVRSVNPAPSPSNRFPSRLCLGRFA
jgi:hypothetical protein